MNAVPHSRLVCAMALLIGALSSASAHAEETLDLTLRSQEQLHDGGRYHAQWHQESWKPAETAIIVCDMWDAHHCLNAVKRGAELTPRMNEVLKKARDQGVLIIHSPSGCMAAYKDHPARIRAMAVTKAASVPKEIANWCHWLPDEEKDKYPIDQSNGGEDDNPIEHAEWAKKLESQGLNPRAPWKKQTDGLTIDSAKDYITDSGTEVWSIQEQHGIKNVILLGVHTNMCVLGRPFGLRRMAENGRNVVLMRDMTDTMYDPRQSPYVSHFTGTDLIVNHIEKHVCPTITSGQILGDGKEFRFAGDDRKNMVIVSAENEYQSDETLPAFAKQFLGQDFRVSYVFADDKDRDQLQGWQAIQDADVLLISVRRRALPEEQLAAIRAHVEASKPIVGIRTASHAFDIHNAKVAEGHAVWPEFDADVWGGSYHNHHSNKTQAYAKVADGAKHPILTGIDHKEFPTGGSLYKTSPLGKNTTLLLTGRIDGLEEVEPVAWTNTTTSGGKAFYTSLGHRDDFANPAFQKLLVDAIYWAAGQQVPSKLLSGEDRAKIWQAKYAQK
ncbi:isochorismatase family protein [bacterium]|nr:isochorismatase family protein [bacterium]